MKDAPPAPCRHWRTGSRRSARRPRRTSPWARSSSRACSSATEQVTVPLDRLEAIGRADMDRNLAALREACGKFMPGADLRACVDKVYGRKPEAGAVAEARRQLPELRRSSCARPRDHPEPGAGAGRAGAAVQRAEFRVHRHGRALREEPARRSTTSRRPTRQWTQEEQAEVRLRARTHLLFTSVHEVWPGHFLQFLHANRCKLANRTAVRGLRLRGRLGALHRGDDVGRRACARAAPRRTSARSSRR